MSSLPSEFADPDRDLRQREVVPPKRLAACHAVVVGVGAIGRQVALQLAAVGIPLLVLFDHDTVGVENLASQGYRPDQLGLAKVDASAADCLGINPRTQVIPKAEHFRRSSARHVTMAGSPWWSSVVLTRSSRGDWCGSRSETRPRCSSTAV